jgi:murein DD-endopeptidase MepM/ murein hydrolase activator NlpD
MGPSSAGAIGWMQFMPSTWLRWGTDANGDGIADPWNPDDAVFSAARYLSAAGGRTDIARAVFAYNHADWYVREVLSLANLFGNAGSSGTFALDRLQMTLDRAEQAVADAAQALAQARRDAQRLRGKRDVLLVRAGAQPLLSARIDLEARAGEADYAAGSASSRVERARKRLAAARAELVRARAESQAASFAPGAAQMLSSPSFQDGYVFPVGGGPSLVSASHTHHDYPAVDIAAPEGSPVYALANAVVLEAWAGVDPRCGIGLTVRTEDNLVWTYCHLSYREPSVQPGALLSAGQPVGLVGSTGHATGPHLHLQLQPATAWPQQMPWFQHFAGLAFRWQDGETRSLDAVGVAAARGPVFAEVPTPAASPDRVIAFSVG